MYKTTKTYYCDVCKRAIGEGDHFNLSPVMFLPHSKHRNCCNGVDTFSTNFKVEDICHECFMKIGDLTDSLIVEDNKEE